jgi:Lipocalin-like domain
MRLVKKDNTATFQTDGKFVTDEGATKCDPTDPQTSTATYTLSSDQKVITIKDSGISLDFKIVEISATTLKMEFTFLEKVVQTYTRQ